jgi:hypothetical protein
MKIGYSIFLDEHVEAKGLDYADCRDFQIVCHECRDAVYKVGAPHSDRQHLSHYPTSRSDVIACEERVATYDRTRLNAEDAESKGQHLRLFQDVFIERSLLAIVKPGSDPEKVLGPISEMIDAAVTRPTFRDHCRRMAARTRQNIEGNAGMREVVGDGQGYRNGQHTEFWIQRQIEFSKQFVRHIVTPSATRTLYHAIALGIYKLRRNMQNHRIQNENPELIDKVSETLLYGNEQSYARLLKKCKRTVFRDKGVEYPATAMIDGLVLHALKTTLMEFPYVEAAIEAGRARSPSSCTH